ncbi:hypothetical protein QBC46DRAFT_357311 [Diplogelasinospora grovesii]|uniref:Uncharacterized protein n=1 Tax=Diplogelasinospora grovesii TaxID=303347 RepID=A0AAN6N118_9PEZI|nr:hypothetical protein QBC46DRAFT_357311 [Diplogelasinospora grovesii]
MFAAASNDGANRSKGDRIPFPARMHEVICINSSDGYGKASDFNPPPSKNSFNFATLGEAVSTSDPSTDAANSGSRRTGTSFATPTAAAIAALFIEFAMQKPLSKDRAVSRQMITRDGMIKIFAGMSEDPVQGFRYLRPWDLIQCEKRSDGHDCKSCRADAVEKVKVLLAGPIPITDSLIRIPELPHVTEAEFDSRINEDKGKCLAGTREELLRDIAAWIADPQGRLIGWLTGRAGRGKFAIARTVAIELRAKHILGATFFFSRNHQSRQDVFGFVTTVAHQLRRHVPALAQSISAAVTDDPDLATREKGCQAQWEKLVTTPLKSIESKIVIVIDALDEPETLIEDGFVYPLSEPHRFDLDSEMISQSTDRDISELIRHDLGALKKRIEARRSAGFINEETVEKLTRKSAGLFVHAKVACRYISGDDHDGYRSSLPEQRLSVVLSDKLEGFDDLDNLYTEILKHATRGRDQHQLTKELRHILELIIALFEPMREEALNKLCTEEVDPRLFNDRLHSLRSVLVVPESFDQPVQIFHESFRTFLLEKAGEEFRIDEKRAHQNLFARGMRLMSGTGDQNSVLKSDICSIGHPGIEIQSIDQHTINSCLPLDIQYACSYWVGHFEKLDGSQRKRMGMLDKGEIHMFLEKHFLHWLEALCLTRRIRDGVSAINKLINLLPGTAESSQLMSLSRDAQRFIRYHYPVIVHYPLQLYASALVFSPTASRVRELFKHEKPEWIPTKPGMDDDWGPCLQILESGSLAVTFAFAHDSVTLASAGAGIISIWDVAKGECRHTLSHSNVSHVVFSHDSKILASASRMVVVAGVTSKPVVNIWNISTGRRIWTLDGHTDSIGSIAFSHDGKTLVSVSDDATVKLWNMQSGKCDQTLEGFEDRRLLPYIHTWVSFSHNSTSLVAASYGAGVKIWRKRSQQWHSTTESHGDIREIAFPHDGKTFASISSYDTMEIRDIVTGKCLHSFMGLREPRSITYSYDATMLAFASSHSLLGTTAIAILDVALGRCIQVLNNGNFSLVIAFSPDSKLLASTSGADVNIWDTTTGKHRQVFRNDQLVMSMAFSHDVKVLVTAGHRDITIWDLTTNQMLEEIAFSHDDELIASALGVSWDNDVIRVLIWEIRSQECLQTLMGHSSKIRSFAFSHDSKLLASGSWDRTVKIWDVVKGLCLRTLDMGTAVCNISFDPTDSYLHTDFGLICLDGKSPANSASGETASRPRFRGYGLSTDGRWITRDSEYSLWLPSEYRPSEYLRVAVVSSSSTQSPRSTAAPSTVAFGCESGRVLLLKFPVDDTSVGVGVATG